MRNEDPKIKRIGLLTPYDGGNLGDGAIQDAVIANIRARFREVHIYGFTLHPDETERRHNIPCFPLTALPIRYYYQPALTLKASDIAIREEANTDFIQHVKEMIKKVSLAYRILSPIHQRLTAVLRTLMRLPAEVKLIKRSYEMLKEFDLLIVSGGGQLDDYWGGPWGHPYALLKWGLIAKAARTRYVFLSVGMCTLESRLSALFVKYALRLAAYRSYRDQTSKVLLQQMAFTHDDRICPDLALSHEIVADEKSPAYTTLRPVVGISPIAYLSQRWPKTNLIVYENYVSGLVTFTARLIQEGYSILFFATDTPDRPVITHVIDILKRDEFNLDGRIINPFIETVDDLQSELSGVDYVVASRLHGVLFSHLINKPALAISYDRKVTTYMKDVEQSDYCVDIHNFDLDLLTKKFEALRSNRYNIQSALAIKVAQFRNAVQAQYDEVLNTPL